MTKIIRDALILIPGIALIYSSVFYTSFFLKFDGLNPSLLTISDYFDKSVSLFAAVILTLAIWIILATACYTSTFRNHDSIKTKSEKSGPTKISAEVKVSLFFSAIVLLLIFFIDYGQPILFAGFAFLFFAGCIIQSCNSLLPETENSRKFLQSCLTVWFLVSIATIHGIISSNSIREKYGNAPSATGALVLILENGYLRAENGELVFYDKNLTRIASSKIEPRYKAPLACWWGLRMVCPSDFPEDADIEKNI
ncbi:hypothetical protein [Hyphococcus sp.]|uniref:hypothetical protein n=1 Tax=Hyphococcus sp. TaxID=2038636 RepID=UPI003CCC0952